MNSIKKAILLTCFAGSVTSMHAGKWDNFKNSCSGLYTACLQSLENSSKVKVIAPAVSVAKMGVAGMAHAAQFTCENPKLVTAGVSAAITAYVLYCRNSTQNWYPTLDQANQVTSDVDSYNKLKDWRTVRAKDNSALSIVEILAGNPDAATRLYPHYVAFKKDKCNVGESHDAFIERISKILSEDQKNLKLHKDNIKKYCLSECRILPSLRSRLYHENHNFVDTLINERIETLNNSERFIDLSEADMRYIETQIENKINSWGRYFNPLRMVRGYALPHEENAIEQYWKLTKSIQRLEALKELLYKQKNALN